MKQCLILQCHMCSSGAITSCLICKKGVCNKHIRSTILRVGSVCGGCYEEHEEEGADDKSRKENAEKVYEARQFLWQADIEEDRKSRLSYRVLAFLREIIRWMRNGKAID